MVAQPPPLTRAGPSGARPARTPWRNSCVLLHGKVQPIARAILIYGVGDAARSSIELTMS